MKELKKILVSGEGGQGVLVLSKVLVKAAYNSGRKISYVPNYGVEQRGGVSLGFIQVSNKEIGFPKFNGADILVILAERAVPRVGEYITKDTLIIYDKTLVKESLLEHLPNQKIAISAYEIAEKKMVAKVFNMIVLGFLAHIVGGISLENLKIVVNETLSSKYKKNPELQHFNERALEMGMSDIVRAGQKEEAHV